jgi:hypothetical protein
MNDIPDVLVIAVLTPGERNTHEDCSTSHPLVKYSYSVSPTMAKGLASSAGFYSKKSSCSAQPAKVSTDGHDNVRIIRPTLLQPSLADNNVQQNLDHSIKQAFQLHSGKQFKAFVVMALDEDGNVVTHTTNHIQQGTDGIFARDAEECLRIAHKSSISQARPTRDVNGMF